MREFYDWLDGTPLSPRSKHRASQTRFKRNKARKANKVAKASRKKNRG